MGGREAQGSHARNAQRTRVRVYLAVRLLAAISFVLAATVLPRGIPAALVIVTAGIAAVVTCFGTNAGGPGERAGARPQDRWFDAHTAPQGQWPPYDWRPDAPAWEPDAAAPVPATRPPSTPS